MKFLVDNQLPARLAIHLRNAGHDCTHVVDRDLDEASDLEIWEFARKELAVLISKDEDFIFLANRPGDNGRLVWVRLGNCRNAVLTAAFDLVLHDLVNAFATGQRIVEVR